MTTTNWSEKKKQLNLEFFCGLRMSMCAFDKMDIRINKSVRFNKKLATYFVLNHIFIN